MTDLLTTADIARAIGRSRRRVLQLAEARGILPARLAGRARLWAPEDLPRFAPGPTGRPKGKPRTAR